MEEFEPSNILLLLTLGTPRQPPAKGMHGVIDQTRGLLDYVEKNCSRAVYTLELRYVRIAGRGLDSSVTPQLTLKTTNQLLRLLLSAMPICHPPMLPFRAHFVGQGYKQVCGQTNVWGDGVVSEVSAHLEGALNISFDGVYHSPVGSDDELGPWYGSPTIVEQWIERLLN
ncbi:hypothetical protein RJ641_016487 [Dillenia turbinata]|uniref:Uncharacterized protein n=1 Tax=Dillenia turbinata TaxID=194707 RepID=A0AAN8UM56_9MAGN